MNYEEASKRLEEIIDKLENGNLPMSEAISLFEEGERLSKICFQHLTSAKGKLTLLKDELDKLTEIPEE